MIPVLPHPSDLTLAELPGLTLSATLALLVVVLLLHATDTCRYPGRDTR